MTAHDPALVERLVQAAEDWLDNVDPFAGLDAYDRERCAWRLTVKHLDVLAAEGRLCEPDRSGVPACGEEEPGRPGRLCALPAGHHCHRAYVSGGSDTWETVVDVEARQALEAERDRLAAEVERLRAALAEVLEVLRTSRGAGDAARVAREALAEPEPLIDPDCRDGKHSSCVGAPCECPKCEHPR